MGNRFSGLLEAIKLQVRYSDAEGCLAHRLFWNDLGVKEIRFLENVV